METLDVKGNRLSIIPPEWVTGYSSLANSSLVNVRISFNNFTGPFPAALSGAPQLTFLVINNNTLRLVPLLPPFTRTFKESIEGQEQIMLHRMLSPVESLFRCQLKAAV